MKTMKKVLSAALALTMMLTMVMVPVSAANMITETVLLMNHGMDSNINAWENKADGGGTAAYESGERWGYPYPTDDLGTVITIKDGGTVISTDPAVTAYGEKTITNQALIAHPPVSRTDLRFTYNIKTLSFTDNQNVKITNLVTTAGGSGPEIFSFSTAGKLFYGDMFNIDLDENTAYKVVADVVYDETNTASSAYDMKLAVMTIAGEPLENGTYTANEWGGVSDIADIRKLRYKVEYWAPKTAFEDDVDFIKIDNVKVENLIEREATDFDLKKDITLMDQDLSTIKNWMVVDGTWGKLNEQATYIDGTDWGSQWAIGENARIGFNGGFNTVAGTWEANKESAFSRKVFVKNPINKTNDDLTFIYDITTGPQYPTMIYTIAYVNNNAGGPQLFGYNASTLQLGFGGRGDYTFDFAPETLVDLQPNTDYTVTVKLAYDKKAACYDLIGNVKGGTGENAIDKTVTVDSYSRATTSADFSAVGFRMANGAAISEETPVTVLNIKNMKIVETIKGHIINFSDAKYDNLGVEIKGITADDLANAVAAESDEAADGAWAATDLANIATSFAVSDGYLIGKSAGDSSEDTLKKKFTPINDGDTLKVSTVLKFSVYKDYNNSNAEATAQTSSFRLLGEGVDLSLFAFGTNQFNGGGAWLAEDVTHDAYANFNNINQPETHISGTAKYNWNDGEKAIDQDGVILGLGDGTNTAGKNWSFFEGEVEVVLTAAPNADGETYDLTMTIKNVTEAWRANFTATRNIAKEKVLAMDTIAFSQKFIGTLAGRELIRYRNLKVEKINDNPKTALTEGTNTLYLPIENVTGHEATFAIVAAVCDKTTDEQKDFFIRQYTDHAKAIDNLAIDVEIADPATEYVKLYVFNGYDSLVPYTTPKTIGK